MRAPGSPGDSARPETPGTSEATRADDGPDRPPASPVSARMASEVPGVSGRAMSPGEPGARTWYPTRPPGRRPTAGRPAGNGPGRDTADGRGGDLQRPGCRPGPQDRRTHSPAAGVVHARLGHALPCQICCVGSVRRCPGRDPGHVGPAAVGADVARVAARAT